MFTYFFIISYIFRLYIALHIALLQFMKDNLLVIKPEAKLTN